MTGIRGIRKPIVAVCSVFLFSAAFVYSQENRSPASNQPECETSRGDLIRLQLKNISAQLEYLRKSRLNATDPAAFQERLDAIEKNYLEIEQQYENLTADERERHDKKILEKQGIHKLGDWIGRAKKALKKDAKADLPPVPKTTFADDRPGRGYNRSQQITFNNASMEKIEGAAYNFDGRRRSKNGNSPTPVSIGTNGSRGLSKNAADGDYDENDGLDSQTTAKNPFCNNSSCASLNTGSVPAPGHAAGAAKAAGGGTTPSSQNTASGRIAASAANSCNGGVAFDGSACKKSKDLDTGKARGLGSPSPAAALGTIMMPNMVPTSLLGAPQSPASTEVNNPSSKPEDNAAVAACEETLKDHGHDRLAEGCRQHSTSTLLLAGLVDAVKAQFGTLEGNLYNLFFLLLPSLLMMLSGVPGWAAMLLKFASWAFIAYVAIPLIKQAGEAFVQWWNSKRGTRDYFESMLKISTLASTVLILAIMGWAGGKIGKKLTLGKARPPDIGNKLPPLPNDVMPDISIKKPTIAPEPPKKPAALPKKAPSPSRIKDALQKIPETWRNRWKKLRGRFAPKTSFDGGKPDVNPGGADPAGTGIEPTPRSEPGRPVDIKPDTAPPEVKPIKPIRKPFGFVPPLPGHTDDAPPTSPPSNPPDRKPEPPKPHPDSDDEPTVKPTTHPDQGTNDPPTKPTGKNDTAENKSKNPNKKETSNPTVASADTGDSGGGADSGGGKEGGGDKEGSEHGGGGGGSGEGGGGSGGSGGGGDAGGGGGGSGINQGGSPHGVDFGDNQGTLDNFKSGNTPANPGAGEPIAAASSQNDSSPSLAKAEGTSSSPSGSNPGIGGGDNPTASNAKTSEATAKTDDPPSAEKPASAGGGSFGSPPDFETLRASSRSRSTRAADSADEYPVRPKPYRGAPTAPVAAVEQPAPDDEDITAFLLAPAWDLLKRNPLISAIRSTPEGREATDLALHLAAGGSAIYLFSCLTPLIDKRAMRQLLSGLGRAAASRFSSPTKS